MIFSCSTLLRIRISFIKLCFRVPSTSLDLSNTASLPSGYLRASAAPAARWRTPPCPPCGQGRSLSGLHSPWFRIATGQGILTLIELILIFVNNLWCLLVAVAGLLTLRLCFALNRRFGFAFAGLGGAAGVFGLIFLNKPKRLLYSSWGWSVSTVWVFLGIAELDDSL